MPTVVRGTREFVPLQLKEDIWKCFSGLEQMGVHGMKTRAQELRLVVIWKYYNGREPTDVRGMKRRGRRFEVLQWARENGCSSLEKYKEE